jgi:beta-glucosidase
MARPKLAGAIVFLFLAQFSVAQASSSGGEVEKRVDSILGKMTLAEKITIIGGTNDFYVRPMPRLGTPSGHLLVN